MKWLILIFILGCIALSNQVPRTVTLEDVRDALMHVVQMIRQTEDKLERHEFRERQFDEQLKKSVVTLDKRLKSMEPIRGTVMRLDERIATIETILMQKDAKENEQLQKTSDTVEDIQKNLPIIIEKMKNDIMSKIVEVNKNAPSAATNPHQLPDDVVTKTDLKTLQTDLKQQLDQVTKLIKNVENEVIKLKNDSSKFREINEKSSDSLEKVKRQLSESENLLEKYENKLAEMNNKIPSIPAPNYKEQNEMQSNLLQALDAQKTKVDQIIFNLRDIDAKMKNIPQTTALDNINNNIQQAVQELKTDTTQKFDKSNQLIDNRFTQQFDQNNRNHDQILKAIQDMHILSSTLNKTIENDFKNISEEIKDLSRFEEVLLQTANGVLDTKRRVEYGVHQITSKVEDLLKTYVKDLNSSISDRFDNFELSILDEETGALANLTSKINEEIDQVWRQIGIMHQQMSLNADTLNKLQNQTDIYVNGSLNVMDSMKGKVTQITGRMSEVDENLNYLLGRLSLVTQEFNMIKTGLGSALDQIKSSFIDVQNKLKDSGPGPHNITSNEVV